MLTSPLLSEKKVSGHSWLSKKILFFLSLEMLPDTPDYILCNKHDTSPDKMD